MKKYKLLKDLPFFKKGTIFFFDGVRAYYEGSEKEVLYHPFKDGIFDSLLGEWYEEIKDEKIPKFKVGDYVVRDDRIKCSNGLNGIIYYHKIKTIWYNSYLQSFVFDGYREEVLRKPTQEELEKYFR